MAGGMSRSSNILTQTQATRAEVLTLLEQAYPLVALGLLVLFAICLAAVSSRRRSPGRLRAILVRGTVASCAALLVLAVMEGSVAVYLAWLHRMPHLAMVHSSPRPPDPDNATIVVVGESSAEGVPYRDWLSVGKIVVWQLRRRFPERMFHLEVQARAGWTLEKMHQKLAEARQRPDAVILYAGHNEFASRFGWSWEVPYYRDDPRPWWSFRLPAAISACSPLCRFLRELRDQALVAAPPPFRKCSLVDVPSHTAEQYRERLDDFRRRVKMILADLQASGVLTIVIVPPGNDAGFEPDRSVLPPETSLREREAFSRDFQQARDLELIDRRQCVDRYRALIDRQPGFAEAHFRLARLLQEAGDREGAYREYIKARDLDGHPMRCISALQDVYRQLAPRYGAILIDGPEVFHARHPQGLLDDYLFNDGMHPSFEGHVALAEAVLAGLRKRQAFGWPSSLPAPSISLEECASHFDISIATWKEVCRFAIGFYRTTRRLRFDPADREAKQSRYEDGLIRLEAGESPERLDFPGIGTRSIVGRMGQSASR